MIGRRRIVWGSLGLATGLLPLLAAGDEIEDKRLNNRLELWANYAKRTRNLVVRLTTTRDSSLLVDPLVATGTLIFAAPARLVLRDDGLAGSTTIIEPTGLQIVPNRADAPRTPIDRHAVAAAGWLGDRLLATFAPGEGAELVADSRTDVPRGGHRLDLLPPRDSAIRKLVRSLSLHFDAVTGAVLEILIAEVQGDRVRMQLADHRQNVPDEDLRALMADVDALLTAAR